MSIIHPCVSQCRLKRQSKQMGIEYEHEKDMYRPLLQPICQLDSCGSDAD
jgi:hypothetical protein